MTNLVVALQAEARPIIEALDLVQDRPAGMFPVYCNGGLSLVVSGIGRACCQSIFLFLLDNNAPNPAYARTPGFRRGGYDA